MDVSLMRSISGATGGRFFLGQDQHQLAEIYQTLDRITPKNYKTQSYRPKRQLFMYPLGLGVLLLLAYQLVMFGWASIKGLLARKSSLETRSEAPRLSHV
ncbi:MAG: hypothetical protein JOY93_02255 [Acidobacteriales bacterium]|nr:hypothetical protein [Terriglobales bacterium]